MILKSINAILLLSHARNVNSCICKGVFVQGVLLYVFYFYPQLSELLLPMDRRISEKVSTLVKSGVRRIQEMRRHLHSFIEEELFTGRVAPPMTDARYYPSSRTLLNAVQRACTSFRCTLLQHYTVSVRMSLSCCCAVYLRLRSLSVTCMIRYLTCIGYTLGGASSSK